MLSKLKFRSLKPISLLLPSLLPVHNTNSVFPGLLAFCSDQYAVRCSDQYAVR